MMLFTDNFPKTKTNKKDREIKKYFDEVTTGDGNYSYVNDYGFTQKYSMMLGQIMQKTVLQTQ